MTNCAHLKFNDHAPDLELLDADREAIRLSTLWRERTIVLAFARHFGCPQCKEMVETLVAAAPQLEKNDLALVIVTQGTPQAAKEFCRQYARGVRCLADPGRRAYQAFGLRRANLWQTFLSPHVLFSNLHLWRRKGWATELPPNGQDAMQLGGIFVIGTDGRIRLPYYYDDIADHPPLDLLLHGVMGVNWKKPFARAVAPAHKPSRSRSKK
jgi:peroxiredoxin